MASGRLTGCLTRAVRYNAPLTVVAHAPPKPSATINLHSTAWRPTEPQTLDEVHHQSSDDRELKNNDTADHDEGVPWYLGAQVPRPPQHPLLERHPLPPLPENPPPELGGVLKQLSEEYGIDKITLIDLRPLDPPPAIGENIIMLIGTARSTRHLHATADKLCRWMRSVYRWAPYADGLLGRNELKLIARRKQRRGKTISSQMGEVEEAGSAGWVCVHTGNRGIVTQLFAQCKREEMDLEGLWNGTLERAKRKQQREVEQYAALAQSLKRESRPEPDRGLPNVSEGERLQLPPPTVSGLITQKRHLHHGIPRRAMNDTSTPGLQASLSKGALPSLPKRIDYDANDLGNMLAELAEKLHKRPSWMRVEFPRLNPKSVLEFQIKMLEDSRPLPTLPPVIGPNQVSFTKHCGTGPHDQSSAPFLRIFYYSLAALPPDDQLYYELKFLTLTNAVMPSIYPADAFLDMLHKAPENGRTVRIEHYYIAMCSLAQHGSPGDRSKSVQELWEKAKARLPAEETIDFESSPEFRYLQFMAALPASVRNIRRLFQRNVTPNEARLKKLRGKPFQLGFPDDRVVTHNPLAPINGSIPSYAIKDHVLDYLTALVMAARWGDFWRAWNNLPLAGIRRDPHYYNLVFALCLLSENREMRLKVARLLPDSMQREEPPVTLGDTQVAQSLLNVIARLEKDGDASRDEFSRIRDARRKAFTLGNRPDPRIWAAPRKDVAT